MALSERMKAAREQRGWTREKLAVEADVSYSTIVRMELGRAPRWEHMVKIARALELSLDDLGALTGAYLAHAS